MPSPTPSPTPDRPKPCPLCGKPAAGTHLPFCSLRCKDRDLLAWLGESYRVPGPAADDEDGAGPRLDRVPDEG